MGSFIRKLVKKQSGILLLLSFFTVLYLLTIYPGVGGRINYGDSAKWQFLWAIGGTPHSTGYPTYLLLSKLFGNTLVFLEPTIRITSISLVSAIGTLFVLYKISEIFIRNKLAQFIPSILLGSTYVFWAQATEAEVYTLNALFVSLVIYLSILFHITTNIKWLIAALSVYAVSFGNHLTMVTLLPAFIYIIYVTDYKLFLTRKIIGLSIFIFGLGASQYLYLLYLSHYSGSPYLEFIGPNASIERWLLYITGGQFKSNIGGNNTLGLLFNQAMPKFVLELAKEMGWAIFMIALFFILYQKVNQPKYNRIVVFLTLIGLFQSIYALSFKIPDVVVYYIPVFLVIALLLSKSLDLLQTDTSKNFLAVILLSVNIFVLPINYMRLKVDSNPRYEEISNLFQLLPDNSTLFIPREDFYKYLGYEALKFAQYIDFSDKNIQHKFFIPDNAVVMYVPAAFVQKIPIEEYSLTPFDNDCMLYIAIPKFSASAHAIEMEDMPPSNCRENESSQPQSIDNDDTG